MKRSNSTLIVWDESDQDVTAEADAEYPDAMSTLTRTRRRGREYGLGDIIGVSRISRVSPNLLAEAGIHCILQQTDAHAIGAAMRTLVLPQGSEHLLASLNPGTAIIRLAHRSRWTHPMLVAIDDEPVRRQAAIATSNSFCSAPGQALHDLPNLQKALDELIGQHRAQKARHKVQDPDRASRRTLPFLRAKLTSGWAPDRVVWELTGDKVPHFMTQKAIIKELVDKKLLEVQEVRLGRANVMVSRLTKKACDLLHHDPPKSVGVGGPAHQFICHWIVMDARHRGIEGTCEWRGTGTNHPADCGCRRPDDRWDAFEVVVDCHANLVGHLHALEACPDVASVTVVCIQQRVVAQLQKNLANEPVVAQLGDRLRWTVAEEYMRRLWP